MSWKRSFTGTLMVSTSAWCTASPTLRRYDAGLPLSSEIPTRGMAARLRERDRGVGKRLHEGQAGAVDAEALAGVEHHVLAAVFFRDPDAAGARADGAADGVLDLEGLAAADLQRGAGKFEVHGGSPWKGWIQPRRASRGASCSRSQAAISRSAFARSMRAK